MIYSCTRAIQKLSKSCPRLDIPPVAFGHASGRQAFGLFFFSQQQASKQMNLSSKPVESCLVGVRIFSHPKAKPHPGHPTNEAAGSTISGSGAKRPLPEPVRRKRVDSEIPRQVVQKKKMYEEWKAAAGHPDEPEAEADSILPGEGAKHQTPEPASTKQGRRGNGAKRPVPEQDHIAGKQRVNGAVDYPDDAIDWIIPPKA
jgi:hypothetical protein